MRIAFVGKGGSGKTTLSALFAEYIKTRNPGAPLLVIDADLNIHLPELLGITKKISENLHISHPDAVKTIKNYLKGANERIETLGHFRKTTPPGKKSNFIILRDSANPILKHFGIQDGNMRLMIVGTYDTDDIGASCYHNNLAILENILSHLLDHEGTVVTDMVAGVDAFANTLHAQFDLLVLVVEPTKRGMEVFEQYNRLAEDAGISTHLFAVGNKIRTENDRKFIKQRIPEQQLIGFFEESDYLRRKDQEGGGLKSSELENQNQKILAEIFEKLISRPETYQTRLEKLWELHRRYVAQDFIRERFGDLTGQIDTSFNLDHHAKSYSEKKSF